MRNQAVLQLCLFFLLPPLGQSERLRATQCDMCSHVLRAYGQWLADTLPQMIDTVSVSKGELSLLVPINSVTQVLLFLRDNTNCQV